MWFKTLLVTAFISFIGMLQTTTLGNFKKEFVTFSSFLFLISSCCDTKGSSLRTKPSTLYAGRHRILRQIFRLSGRNGKQFSLKASWAKACYCCYNCFFCNTCHQANEEFCDDGLVFDAEKERCELPHAVQCGTRTKQRNLIWFFFSLVLDRKIID